MRFDETPLLKIDDSGAKVPDEGYVVRIPVCTSKDDPKHESALLVALGTPPELLHSEPMVLLVEPYHGRLVYVLAIEQHRYNPATAIEGTINEFVNGIIMGASGPSPD